MADPLPSPPSPPPPPDPKPPTRPAGKSPIKRKTTTANTTTHKRPNIPPPSAATSTADLQDTATSKRKVNPQDVDLDDIEVLQSLLDYRTKRGVFPFETPAAMKAFLLPWTILYIGNEDGWKARIEKVKTKFTRSSEPVEDEERKEFELWMKIWGNDNEEGGDDHDPSGVGGS